MQILEETPPAAEQPVLGDQSIPVAPHVDGLPCVEPVPGGCVHAGREFRQRAGLCDTTRRGSVSPAGGLGRQDFQCQRTTGAAGGSGSSDHQPCAGHPDACSAAVEPVRRRLPGRVIRRIRDASAHRALSGPAAGPTVCRGLRRHAENHDGIAKDLAIARFPFSKG